MQGKGFGFAPDELDLAHLDQNQTVSAPSSCKPQEPEHRHAWPDNLSSLPNALPQEAVPQQLTHLDSHGRAQMVDVGQVPVMQILRSSQHCFSVVCKLQLNFDLCFCRRLQLSGLPQHLPLCS